VYSLPSDIAVKAMEESIVVGTTHQLRVHLMPPDETGPKFGIPTTF
jgi:hypothetical protein